MSVVQSIWPYVAALLPTIGLAYLFWVIMKHILEGDRRERAAQREWERSLDARKAATGESGSEQESDDSPQH